jgi:Subtilase family/Peptidase inhibitor I9
LIPSERTTRNDVCFSDNNNKGIVGQKDVTEAETTTLTIRKIVPETGELLPGGVFRITPNPYSQVGSLIVRDNNASLDHVSCNGIVLLEGIVFSNYTITEISPSNQQQRLHQGEISIHENEPDPVVNFVYRDFDGPEADYNIIPNQYMIFLSDELNEDPQKLANELGARGADILYVYSHVAKGFAAKITDEQLLADIIRDARVAYVEQDKLGYIASFGENLSIPTGFDRVDADLNPLTEVKQYLKGFDVGGISAFQELEVGINVDIAILDTGVSLGSPDLNVYRNISFINGTFLGEGDRGHGTHVAGIASAKGNSDGAMGVAPGARIWAIKVCDKYGGCPVSAQIAAVEYVTEHANEIDVVNISRGLDLTI